MGQLKEQDPFWLDQEEGGRRAGAVGLSIRNFGIACMPARKSRKLLAVLLPGVGDHHENLRLRTADVMQDGMARVSTAVMGESIVRELDKAAARPFMRRERLCRAPEAPM
jgi:hypothetical protein